jgi:hypothetical protein
MTQDELKAAIRKVKGQLRITKVVATRSVKTKRGDYFAGFAAAWNSVQDDAGGAGADMELMTTAAEEAMSGMTFQDAILAHSLVALEADIAAYSHARADGAMATSEFGEAVKALKNNHAKIIRDRLMSTPNGDG